LHLFKLDLKKFWRQNIRRKNKENNMIHLKDWDSYLKNPYESPNSMDNITNVHIENEVFFMEDIEFWVKWLVNGKAKEI